MKRYLILAAACAAALGATLVYKHGRSVWHPLYARAAGARTAAQVLRDYGPAAESRLMPHFLRTGCSYPPERAALLAFKHERRLELWVPKEGHWAFVCSYPILAASGKPGPKLREGDRQVPEGFYRIAALNPNSSYHLSMKLDYPNAFDRAQAQQEGRTRLGGDIFVHGKAASVGCLAMGDPAIEELFVLVAKTGPENVRVFIAPNDLRKSPPMRTASAQPVWLDGLYQALGHALAHFDTGG